MNSTGDVRIEILVCIRCDCSMEITLLDESGEDGGYVRNLDRRCFLSPTICASCLYSPARQLATNSFLIPPEVNGNIPIELFNSIKGTSIILNRCNYDFMYRTNKRTIDVVDPAHVVTANGPRKAVRYLTECDSHAVSYIRNK